MTAAALPFGGKLAMRASGGPLRRLVVPAPAKVNLFLHVTGRRGDGYHTLESLFALVDLADTLTLELRDDRAIVRSGEVPGVPADEDLALRAARRLQEASGGRHGVSIAIDKSNLAHISYMDDKYDGLKYAYDTGSGWEVEDIDTQQAPNFHQHLERMPILIGRLPIQSGGQAEIETDFGQGFVGASQAFLAGGSTPLAAYASLAEIPFRVDLVDVFRAPEHVPAIVDACLGLHLPALWLQEGVVHDEACARAAGAGLTVVADRCLLKEYVRLNT